MSKTQDMSALVVSSIRTIIPVVWGSVVAWLVGLHPLLESIESQATAMGEIVTLVIVALWYVATRSLEPKLPGWLRSILFGVSIAPEYTSSGRE